MSDQELRKQNTRRERQAARRREIMLGTSPVVSVNKAALMIIVGASLSRSMDTELEDILDALFLTDENDL